MSIFSHSMIIITGEVIQLDQQRVRLSTLILVIVSLGEMPIKTFFFSPEYIVSHVWVSFKLPSFSLPTNVSNLKILDAQIISLKSSSLTFFGPMTPERAQNWNNVNLPTILNLNSDSATAACIIAVGESPEKWILVNRDLRLRNFKSQSVQREIIVEVRCLDLFNLIDFHFLRLTDFLAIDDRNLS